MGHAMNERLFGANATLPSGDTTAFLCLSAPPQIETSPTANRPKADRSRVIQTRCLSIITPIISPRCDDKTGRSRQTALDARPLGAWLGIPVGAAFVMFGFAGLKSMDDDAESAIADALDSPTT